MIVNCIFLVNNEIFIDIDVKILTQIDSDTTKI